MEEVMRIFDYYSFRKIIMKQMGEQLWDFFDPQAEFLDQLEAELVKIDTHYQQFSMYYSLFPPIQHNDTIDSCDNHMIGIDDHTHLK